MIRPNLSHWLSGLLALCFFSPAIAVTINDRVILDGFNNPLELDGATLNSSDNFAEYTFPDGLTLGTGGEVYFFDPLLDAPLGQGTPETVFFFPPGSGGIHFDDPDAFIEVYSGERSDTPPPLTFDMSDNDITAVEGGGIIQHRVKGPRNGMSLTINTTGDIKLKETFLENPDSRQLDLTINSTGSVDVGLTEAFLLDDLTADGSFAAGGTFGENVQLKYIPEPSALLLMIWGAIGTWGSARRRVARGK